MGEWNHPKPKQNALFHCLLCGNIEKRDYKITLSFSNLIWFGENTEYDLCTFVAFFLSPLWTCTKLKTLRGRVCLIGPGEKVFPLPFIQYTHSAISISLKKPGLGPTPLDARRQTLSPDTGSECCPLTKAHHTVAFWLPSRLKYTRLHQSLKELCPRVPANLSFMELNS